MDKQSAKEVVLARWPDAKVNRFYYEDSVRLVYQFLIQVPQPGYEKDCVMNLCNDQSTEEAAWQSASLHQSVAGAESLYQCSYTASGEHAPSVQGDCIYCSCKGRDHKLRPAPPAPQAEKDDLKEQVWQAYLRNENNMRLDLNRLRNSAPQAEKVEVAERKHKWSGLRRVGGHPANAESYEFVRICEVCGMEDTCEVPPCPGDEIEVAEEIESAEDRETMQLIDERDQAEDAVGDIYASVTGRQAEWSNLFGYTEAVNEVHEVMHALRTPKPAPQPAPAATVELPLYDDECLRNMEIATTREGRGIDE